MSMMINLKLKDCKVCGAAQDDDSGGVQLQSVNHIYGPELKDSYEVGYSVFCCSCGLTIHDEYLEDVINMWNKLHD